MWPFDRLSRRYGAWLARTEAAAEARSSFEADHPDASTVDVVFRGEKSGTRFFAVVYSTGLESGPLPYKLYAVRGDESEEVSPEDYPELPLAEDEQQRA
jgi:hypothetical protein